MKRSLEGLAGKVIAAAEELKREGAIGAVSELIGTLIHPDVLIQIQFILPRRA
jgi:hypothetical protein